MIKRKDNFFEKKKAIILFLHTMLIISSFLYTFILTVIIKIYPFNLSFLAFNTLIKRRLNFVEKVNFFLQGKIDKLMYNNILLSHKNSIFIPNLIERKF